MDPTSTLKEALDALRNMRATQESIDALRDINTSSSDWLEGRLEEYRSQATQHLEALLKWLKKGGHPPKMRWYPDNMPNRN